MTKKYKYHGPSDIGITDYQWKFLKKLGPSTLKILHNIIDISGVLFLLEMLCIFALDKYITYDNNKYSTYDDSKLEEENCLNIPKQQPSKTLLSEQFKNLIRRFKNSKKY